MKTKSTNKYSDNKLNLSYNTHSDIHIYNNSSNGKHSKWSKLISL